MSEDIKKIQSYYTLISELKLKRDILNNNINSNLKNDYYASLDIQLKEINDSGKDAIKIQNEQIVDLSQNSALICDVNLVLSNTESLGFRFDFKKN